MKFIQIEMFKKLVVLVFLIPMLSGCASRLLMLKHFIDEQKTTDDYVRFEERGYRMLKYDLLNDKITEGESRRQVVSRYGDPVFCRNKDGGECCLYRLPLDFFSGDRAYLYFDVRGLLYAWKLNGGG
jgi:hypothetical protein